MLHHVSLFRDAVDLGLLVIVRPNPWVSLALFNPGLLIFAAASGIQARPSFWFKSVSEPQR
jgi:hypothetical protein